MKDLSKFVEVWEKTGKIEDILSADLSLPSAEEAKIFLSTLSESEQIRIRTSLEAATAALMDHTSKLETEATELKAQIDQASQASNACIAYTNTPRKS